MSVENKTYDVRYLTHMIVFPDGDAFVEQRPFVHDLQFEGRNWLFTVFHHQNNPKSCVDKLITKGEVRCESKSPYGKLTHIYTIEDKERPTGMFGAKEGIAQ